MYKTILTHVRPTPDSAEVLRLAVEFARAQDAQLVGVGGREPFQQTGDYVAGDILQMIADQEDADLNEARSRFDTLSAALGNRAHWRVVRKRPDQALSEEAAGADIIVVALERRDRDGSIDCSNLVLEAGLPVLAVPSTVRRFIPKDILIAWRNTAEAHRVLTSALPLLKAADNVTLLEVAKADRAQDAWTGLNAAVARLSQHGISANAVVRPLNGDAADTLLAEAEARMSDLIVLGAYGHSRAREWVLGGVTRDLIDRTPIPLLLMH